MSKGQIEAETVLQDAVDLHCHIDLEFGLEVLRKAQPEWEWLPLAESVGMKAIVLKSHWWPTGGAAYYLNQIAGSGVKLVPSITLNPVSGGINVYAVESAVAMGCRVVFMPTWGSQGDLDGCAISEMLTREYRHFDSSRVKPSIIQQDGKLADNVYEVLTYCLEENLVLATGHLSVPDSLLLARVANSIGFERLIFSHPLSHSVGASQEAVNIAASNGAFIEFPWTLIAPGRRSADQVVSSIRATGINRSFIATDYFRLSSPPPPLLLRSFAVELLGAGLGATEMQQLVALNPWSILDA